MNMDNNGKNDSSSSSNAVEPVSKRYSAPARTRRSSSRISVRSSSSPRNQSNLRGRVSKAGSVPRRSVKNTTMAEATSKTSQEEVPDLNDRIDHDQPMEDENIPTEPINFDSEPEDPCDASIASVDTVVDPSPSLKKKRENRVMNYFTYINSNGKYKCSICNKVEKFSHLSS